MLRRGRSRFGTAIRVPCTCGGRGDPWQRLASARLCELLDLDPSVRLVPTDGWVVPVPTAKRDAYRELAARTGLSAGYLNHLVHGNRPVPSDKVVAQLAKALGVAPEHFREYRLRVITDRLERMPELIDKLYRRYSA